MGELFNAHHSTQKRRSLRQNAAPAEVLLWAKIRGRQLGGWKFRRQFGIAHYIADFGCVECKIVIELDGATHESDKAQEYDLYRQQFIESLGFEVLRFRNEQVYREMDSVLETLLARCEARRPSPPPTATSHPVGRTIFTALPPFSLPVVLIT